MSLLPSNNDAYTSNSPSLNAINSATSGDQSAYSQAQQNLANLQKQQQQWQTNYQQQQQQAAGSGQNQSYLNNFNVNPYSSQVSAAQQAVQQAQGTLSADTQQAATKQQALQPLQQAATTIQGQATQFQNAMPSISDNAMAMNRNLARQTLAQNLQTNNANYNSRGLLYGGLKAGGAADQATAIGQQLTGAQANVNQNLQSDLNTLNNNALQANSALTSATQNFNQADSTYRQQLLNSVLQQQGANQQIIGGLIGAGGQILGQAAGNIASPTATQPTQFQQLAPTYAAAGPSTNPYTPYSLGVNTSLGY